MRIITLLRKLYPLKGFVYGKAELVLDDDRKPYLVRIELREDKRQAGHCGGCGQPGSVYDHLPSRAFKFIPLWGLVVEFLYARRRIDCAYCGVTAEALPWAMGTEGKSPLTVAFACFLAMWAKELSWTATAARFRTTWHEVWISVQYVVAYGLEHRDLTGITALGVDEISYGKGHKYLTVVYQLNAGYRRLLWVGKKRTEKTLNSFFDWFGEVRSNAVEYVCSDMWKPYLKVIAQRAVKALNILDRFHIMMNLNKALDLVRREETQRLSKQGVEPVLKHSRWCFLKRKQNLTGKQATKLRELVALNLRSVRAYLLKEEFQRFWEYTSTTWAGKFLDDWCRMVMRSRIEPFKKMACTLRRHRDLILNWFAAKGEYNSGMVEGLNNRIRTRIKIAYGYRNPEVLRIALFHELGQLPVPEIAHRFF